VSQVRLKLFDAIRLHALPSPTFKIKHAFPLWDTGLCLHAAFVQPLDLNRLTQLGKSGMGHFFICSHIFLVWDRNMHL
jgi:hypothetical protein